MSIYKGSNKINRIWKGNELITCISKGSTIVYPEKAGFGCRQPISIGNMPVMPETGFSGYRPYACTTSPKFSGINQGDSRIVVTVRSVSGKYIPIIYIASNCSITVKCYCSTYRPTANGIEYRMGKITNGSAFTFASYSYSGSGMDYDVFLTENISAYTALTAGTYIFPIMFKYNADDANVVISNISWEIASYI